MTAVTIAPVDGAAAGLGDELAALWVEVTAAGGAVGFRPPATAADVAPVVDDLLLRVDRGVSRLLVARADGEVAGLVAVTRGARPRFGHRVTLGSLQVHPGRQGTGLGRRLVAAAHDLAVAEFDAELALVQVRDGLGLDRFYARLGYVEVGRVPGGLAFEDGDRIDELTMVRRLP